MRQVKPQVLHAPPAAQQNGKTPRGRPSFETTSSSGSSGGQALVETDALLPYRRTKGNSELDRMRAELELFDEEETPSREQPLPSTVRPPTQSPKDVDDLYAPSEREPSLLPPSRVSHTEHRARPSSSRASPPPVPQKNPHRVSPPRREYARMTLEPDSPPPEDDQSGRRTARDPHNSPRIQQPLSDYVRRWAPELSQPKHPAASNGRARVLIDGVSSPAPRASTRTAKQPDAGSVRYETVEGVNLETQPKSIRGNPAGLSIPEIEARDIQKIPDQAPERLSEDEERSTRQWHYARSPPPVGTNHDYVRPISPRPVINGQDHVLVDGYSRAADKEMPDQRAEVRARYRLSLVAPFSKYSPPQTAEDQSDVDGAAEAPVVARTREFEAQDLDMNGRKHQAKSLIKGMLKGLTGRKDDMRYGHDRAVDHAAVAAASGRRFENGYGQAHDGIYRHDDDDDDNDDYVDHSQHGRNAVTSIWSPNDMRRSADTVVLRGHTPV